MELPPSKKSNSADSETADWNKLPRNLIVKIAGYVVANNGCYVKTRRQLRLNKTWQSIVGNSAAIRTHLKACPYTKTTKNAGPPMTFMYKQLEKTNFSNLKHLEVSKISYMVR